jgi:hypothetical protein
MSEIFKEFASVLSRHSEKTDTAIEKLAGTVEKLAINHIETKKDREHDNARAERHENIQREQGKKIETLSDTVLILDERVSNHKNKWIDLTKFCVAIATAVTIAKFLPL